MATFNESDPIVILSYARTPMGSFQGSLTGASATELGATAVRAAVERAGVAHDAIENLQKPRKTGEKESSNGADCHKFLCARGVELAQKDLRRHSALLMA